MALLEKAEDPSCRNAFSVSVKMRSSEHNLKNFWIFAAGLSGLTSIGMGAVASHLIQDPAQATMADKASIYQLAHSVLIFVLVARLEPLLCAARWAILLGIILFCGSICVRAICSCTAATKVAPMGGICLMAGWSLIMVAGLKRSERT